MSAALLLLAAAAPAPAADEPPRIIVSATGSVATPPDRATVDYTVRGEGQTSDAAVGVLVARRRAIEGGIGALGQPVTLHAGRVSVREARDPRCRSDDDDAPRLASGNCAVVGYIAEISASAEMSDVTQAGTAVGLVARLGATNPRIEGFTLSRPQEAERAALAAALADARRKAEAVAAGAGVRLGRLLAVSTDPDRADAMDVVVTGNRVASSVAVMPPPIRIEVAPAPVETQARVSVTYAIAP